MILTQCAVCATELGLSLGKKCGRCSTRYCGAECQVQHWKEGGHDQLCKSIKRGGGAEQYNADQRYTKAVAVAAEACAEDTKGETCYICTQALHWKTKEGLVRGCACRGTAGFAHVSCLAEQAKILVDEGMENHLDEKVLQERWARWMVCSQCDQQYHGVVACALGWACWKTYVGRSEEDNSRLSAVQVLGNGLYAADHYEDALSVQVADLALVRRVDAPEYNILLAQANLAGTYEALGRPEALQMKRDVYTGYLRLYGEEGGDTITAASNYARCLTNLRRFEEAKSLLRKTMPVARRVIGESDEVTLRMRSVYALALCKDTGATLDDLREGVTTLEEIERIARQVFGGANPLVMQIAQNLGCARALLGARDGTAAVDALREAVAALGRA